MILSQVEPFVKSIVTKITATMQNKILSLAMEDTDDVILSIAAEINCDIALADIDRSHRINQPPIWTSPNAIIVKFATYRARDKFYKNRSSLKGNQKFT